MSTKSNRFNSSATALLIVFVVVAGVAYPVNGLKSRELDENAAPSVDQGIKCTPSCTQSPPPPSPPPPPACPPPPVLYPPPRHCCPAAPTPPAVVYTIGPPWTLYPVDQNSGGSTWNLEVGLLALVSGFMVLLGF